MFKRVFNFSTKMNISQIVGELQINTKGKHLSGHKRIEPNYIGEFDRNGFYFSRSELNFLGNHNFNAKFIESESGTKIIASVRPSAGTFLFYFLLVSIMILSSFVNQFNLNVKNMFLLSVLAICPILIMYLSFIMDVKKAKMFLIRFFDMKNA